MVRHIIYIVFLFTAILPMSQQLSGKTVCPPMKAFHVLMIPQTN